MENVHGEQSSKPRRLWAALTHWFKQEVIDTPLTPTLQPTRLRLQLFGAAMVVGHPLFWAIWSLWLPQPYENLPLRLVMSGVGLLFFTRHVLADPTSASSGRVVSTVLWLNLPFSFWWMYLANGGNHVWLASMAAMTLIYYAVTDWRLATFGILSAGVVSFALLQFVPNTGLQTPMPLFLILVNTVVIGFCVVMGMILGLSAANLRREQLAATLITMGIMAHELRTPLATITLIGTAVRGSASRISQTEEATELEGLAHRLEDLVRSMNHQLNTQMANARLLRLPESKDVIRASSLVKDRIAQFPFRSARERACVIIEALGDFRFFGSQPLFGQVIDNLVKNALRSQAAIGGRLAPGDVVIRIEAHHDHGRIAVTDRGVGIERAHINRIFEPFFSTNHLTGHGLGLAFCKRVVDAAGGAISVTSQPGEGARFEVELPLASETPQTTPAMLRSIT
ncbi:MAG: putative histidine kinase, classic [Ramlibacter sp.]|jgi:signal transduction histidine kinase|nr:putative histidine kinase, classic [Ramlibacter sp.]